MTKDPKKITPPRRSMLLLGVLFLFLFNVSFAQNIQLEKLNQYSFLTNDFGNQLVHPDISAKFMGSTDKAHFFLNWVKPGLPPSSIIGIIENNSIQILDSLVNDGVWGELINLIPDGQNNLIYSSIGFNGGIIKKINDQGIDQWFHFLATDSIYSNPHVHILDQDKNSILVTRTTVNSIDYNVSITKINNETGTINWKTDNLTQSKVFYVPVYLKEFEDHFKVISSKGDSLNFAKIDKEGEFISSNTLPNPNPGDIFKYINMDSLGHTYIGLNAWGYRCPKIDKEGQTIWHYIKTSPFGIEDGNRTTDILLDENLNVYIGGPFRFVDEPRAPLLLSKLNDKGELVWETTLENLESPFFFYPQNSYLHENRIWITGLKASSDNQQLLTGAIACFDIDGNFLLYKDIEAFGPYGFALSMDFFENEMLLTGSSRSHPDSIFQHILHYKIDTLTSTTNTISNQIIIHPYPNPTTDWISILQTPSQKIQDLTITATNGRNIPLPTSILDNHRVDLSLLPTGIYFIRYRIEKQVYLGRVIKK